ncbi:PMS1 protein homolog 1 [Corythoichthys intestinalis]|uniref:PMS1 protein homolog 1 n=1 Tax=Corythoichthys intestinalis TaxID=161448 RepID=UPI0025A61DBA|nr:PMS1 protein homolog 1 [Corythoichthys intestinalis]XP_057707471.1 PMS1 protein homolog 1 [Corythoichthys intestinalis]XP_061799795.1 PMS1 protein homolog 1-like [Nerophis lumbriciformis]
MKQLPADTVRLLSSSQVITSVTNVVKELLENSLDAGALAIDVKLENYGLDRIEVRDNGRGIKAADTRVMALRHFTSKIQSHEDLERLQTYGFRGEALGSICAIAEVMITTKTEDDDISTQYTLNNQGSIVSQKPTHLGQGTTVSVLKLFKNVPVRRQYFSSAKRCKDEVKKVQDLLVAYAIIIPDLRLTLTHNKVVIWQKAKAADHRSALLATLGSNTVANLLPCHHHQEEAEIFLEGFFPKPGADVSSTSTAVPDKTFIYVNDRPVHHKDIIKLLRQHYAAQYADESAQNRYPILMLKIAVSPSSVDVNLTPDKTQVLLHNKEALFTALEALLVSLYGYRPGRNSPTEQLGRETSLMPSSKTGAVEPGDEITTLQNVVENHTLKNTLEQSKQPPSRRTSDSSSSSSVAEDWIVNRMPGGDETKRSSSELPKALEDDADLSRPRISAEEWSKGTALTDPISGEPLEPVRVHQISAPISPVVNEIEANKKTSNIITEKRVALTAFDLISNRTLRAPQSPVALFEKEARIEVLREKPTASVQEISIAVNDRWKNLMEEDRKKYEEKAKKQLEHHDRTCAAKLANSGGPKERRAVSATGQKRKAPPFSNQQLLDELFSAHPQKKPKSPQPRPSRPLPCCLSSLRSRLQRLSSSRNTAAPQGLRLINRLASQSVWVILCGQRLMLLNPFRVQETLLLEKLLQNNILPAVTLQNPIQVTDGSLGGSDYMDALCKMEKQSPDLNGRMIISDPRLVANGFKVRLTPGGASAERHLEVTALADCVPFLGVEDLGEIMTAVLRRKAKTVQECRPLKVSNYLQGEAVRLARQMPTHLSREDVKDILRRMEQQLGENSHTCFHGRPFLHPLSDIPQNDNEAKDLFKPLAL